MKLARVFTRKTSATPDDDLAFVNVYPEMCDIPDVDAVHISVTFTQDKQKAEILAEHWQSIAPVYIGGPAYNDRGDDFVPGRYLKNGYTITSRGCPNKCWFCDAWRRSGTLRELPIRDGWIVQDDNILACSKGHFTKVCDMLRRMKADGHAVDLMGMEAAQLQKWHIDLLWHLKPKQMFFAYDTPDDLEPLIQAGKDLRYADFTRSHLRCYVLCGYPKDTMSAALSRMLDAWEAGFLPFAMLYMDKDGKQDPAWGNFIRTWSRPAATKSEVKRLYAQQLATVRGRYGLEN